MYLCGLFTFKFYLKKELKIKLMRVVNIAAGRIAQDVQIHSPFMGLYINLQNATTDSVGNPTIKADLITKSGTIAIIDKTPIGRLLEMSTKGEGYYKEGAFGVNIGAVLEGIIDIGVDGAFDFTDSGYVSLTIEADPAVNTDLRMIVHTIGSEIKVRRYIQYDPLVIPAGGIKKDISLHGVTAIGLPYGTLSSVLLEYPNSTVEYTSTEVAGLYMAQNDIRKLSPTGSILPELTANSYVLFDITEANRMSFQPLADAGASVVYLLREKTI
jgi:hypothetical protein